MFAIRGRFPGAMTTVALSLSLLLVLCTLPTITINQSCCSRYNTAPYSLSYPQTIPRKGSPIPHQHMLLNEANHQTCHYRDLIVALSWPTTTKCKARVEYPSPSSPRNSQRCLQRDHRTIRSEVFAEHELPWNNLSATEALKKEGNGHPSPLC